MRLQLCGEHGCWRLVRWGWFLAMAMASLWRAESGQTNVALAWDPSPDASVVGYNIYYGTSSRSYSQKISVGNVTSATVPGLDAATTYFFAATAYDSQSVESEFSNEAVYQPQVTKENQPPTLDPIANFSFREGVSGNTVALNGVGCGDGGTQPLSVKAVSSNPDIVPNPDVSTASGSYSLVFPACKRGTAWVTVTVSDGQPVNGTVSRSFEVSVTSGANLPPTIDPVSDITIYQNSGDYILRLTGISPGAGENQNVEVSVVCYDLRMLSLPVVTYKNPESTALVRLSPVPYAHGSVSMLATVYDGQSRDNTTRQWFTVNILTVNQSPTLDPIAGVTIQPNSGETTLPLTGISAGQGESQPLTISATSSNPSAVPAPRVNYVQGMGEGSLTFAALPSGPASAVITVTVQDGGATNNSISRSFSVVVPGGNQPPTLDLIPDVALLEEATEQTRSVRLNGIGTGSASENQTLTISAISSDPNIVPHPAIAYTSPNNTAWLNFTPRAYASGEVTIQVTVNDGQSANATVTRAFKIAISSVNQPPTLNPMENLYVEENAPVQVVPLSGITSGAPNEGQTLTIGASSSDPGVIPTPAVQYASPSSTGALSFQPVPGAFGSVTITVSVRDGGTSNNVMSRAFLVTVGAANRPPTLDPIADCRLMENAGAQSVRLTGITPGAAHETNQTVSLTAYASNPVLVPSVSVKHSAPGTDGTLTFSVGSGVSGTATITVVANDGQGSLSSVFTRSFNVEVTPANRPPTLDPIPEIAVNESASLQVVPLTGIGPGAAYEQQTLTITATSSDTSLVPHPSVNYATPSSSGWLSFVPRPLAFGSCTITVIVSDGQTTNSVVSRAFRVTVNPVNQPPTLSQPADVALQEGTPEHVVALSGIGTGATNETQVLVVSATSSNPSLIPQPRISYASPAQQAILYLNPVSGSFGNATVTVTVNDGGATDNLVSRSFTVTVGATNRPPTLDVIQDVTIVESATTQTVNLTGIGSGAAHETQSLTIAAASSNPGLLPNPVVVYSPPGTTGKLLLTPVAGQSGFAQVTVTVNDGQAVANNITRTFKVTVTPVNRPPTLAAVPDMTIDEGAPLQVITLSGISPGAATEQQTITISAVSSDRAVVPDPKVDYIAGKTSGLLSFTPATYAHGTCTITVTVNDGQSLNNLFTRSFLVTVRPVNQAPTLAAIPDLRLAENAGEQVVTLTGISSGAPNENQTLTVMAQSSSPLLVPTPSVSYLSPANSGSLRLKPIAGASGTAQITVTVADDSTPAGVVTRSFTVTVDAANRAPGLDSIANISLPENSTPQTILLTGITPGGAQENQALTISAKSSNPSIIPDPVVSYEPGDAEGALMLTPSSGVFGTTTITVSVDDGHAENHLTTRSFVVTIQPSNRRPTLDVISDVSINENATETVVQLTGISAGAAFESQPLSMTATSSDPSLIPHPRVSYTSPNSTALLGVTPTPFANGTCQITVTLSDGQASNSIISRVFLVTVIPVNQAPTLNHLPDIAIVENAPEQRITLSGISSGATNELQKLTVTASSSQPWLIPAPKVTYVSPDATGVLQFEPMPGVFGSSSITVQVNDGGAENAQVSRSFNVTIGAVNRRPTLDPIANAQTEENGQLSVRLTGISSGADFESQTVSVSASCSDTTLIPGLVVNHTPGSREATLQVTPARGRFGSATVTVTVSDGQAESGVMSRAFVISVVPLNRPPTLDVVADVTLAEDSPAHNVTLTGITPGASHETQAVALRAVSSNPQVIPDPVVTYHNPGMTASLTISPVPNAFGTAEITVVADDGQSSSSTTSRRFFVYVSAQNDAPTLDPIADQFLTEDGGGRTLTLTGISPGTGDSEQVRITATSGNPSLLPNPVVAYKGGSTATLNLMPLQGSFGRAVISVTVDDGLGQNSTVVRTFSVEVAAVNRPPTLDSLADVTITENSGQRIVALTGISSGREVERQQLTVTATSSNPALIPAPDVAYQSPSATGALVLNAIQGESGTALITVTVNDGEGTANVCSRSFKVTVTPQNRPPTLNALNNLIMAANSPAQVVTLDGISAGAAGEDQRVTVTAMSSDPTIAPHPRVEYSGGSEGKLFVQPAPNASGSVVISVTVDDGQLLSSALTRTFVLTVTDLNLAPTLDPLTDLTVPENMAQVVPLAGITSGSPTEDEALSITAVSSNPHLLVPVVNYRSPDTKGTLSFVPTPLVYGTARLTVTVTDGQGLSLTRTFEVKVVDVNQPPTLDPLESRSIEENSGPQFIPLTGISSGAPNESQRLTITATSSNPGLIANPTVTYTNPSPTGMLVFNTVPNSSGDAMITVLVNDGGSSNNLVQRKFRVTVAQVNQKPTINPLANYTINENAGQQVINIGGITSGAPDESQRLSLTAFSSRPDIVPHPVVSYSSPNSFATLTFTPVQYASGAAQITVTVDDGQPDDGVTTRTFTVTVNAVNQAPTLNPINAVVVAQNSKPVTLQLTGISSGAPNETQTLSVAATSSNTKLVPTPVVTYTSPQSTGTLQLNFGTNLTGTATVSVTVRDGAQQNGATTHSFLVAVGVGALGGGGSNAAPTLSPIPAMTIKENSGQQTVNLSGISSGKSTENQALTVTAVSSNPNVVPHPSVAYTSPSQTGALHFAPAANAYGSAVISVTVDDGQPGNNTVTRSFVVNVTAVNQPPSFNVLTNIVLPVNATPTVIPITGIVAGPANELQIVTIGARSSAPYVISEPSVSYRSGNTAGTLTIVPMPNATGVAIITVTASDGQPENSTFERTFSVIVGDAQIPPTLDPIADVTLPMNASEHIVGLTGISAGASSVDSRVTLAARSSDDSLVSCAEVVYSEPQTSAILKLKPVAGASGVAIITVRVENGASNSNYVERAFAVTVASGSAQVQLGSAIVVSGESNSVPVRLVTDFEGTNLNIALQLGQQGLTNLSLTDFDAAVDPASVRLTWNNPSNATIRLNARAGAAFHGQSTVARLAFVGTGPRTITVPLNVTNSSVALACGATIPARAISAAQVTVVGDEPWLQPAVGPAGERQLIVYGKTGRSYSLERAATPNASAVWVPTNVRFGLTNSTTRITLPVEDQPQVYYRAVEFQAFPPVLEPAMTAGAVHTLTLYGERGATYHVERSSSFDPAARNWTKVGVMTLTNSFGSIEVPSAGPVSLFRLHKQ